MSTVIRNHACHDPALRIGPAHGTGRLVSIGAAGGEAARQVRDWSKEASAVPATAMNLRYRSTPTILGDNCNKNASMPTPYDILPISANLGLAASAYISTPTMATASET